MKIECPSCHYAADVDPAKIPPKGANTKCPRCSKVFFVGPAEPVAMQDTSASIVCPKCGVEQPAADSCASCGIIYEKYRAVQERRLQSEAGDKDEPVTKVAPAAPQTEAAPFPDTDAATFHFGHGRGELFKWIADGHLAAEALPQASRIAGMLPGPMEWRRFLDGLALWSGAIFLALAVIFFFAYNWKELGSFTRFGIAELLLAASVFASWRLGLERPAGKAALIAATLLVGALLALVGQTYQTGADPWELFATWALFVLPWVAISGFSALWLLWLALVNLALALYFSVFAGFFGFVFGTQTLLWTLTAVNTVALAVWELGASRGMPWLAERWPPRLITTVVTACFTTLAAWGILDRSSFGLAELLGYCAWVACSYQIYRHRIRDLYVLALGVLSIVSVAAIFLGHNLGGKDAGALLLVGVTVLGLSAAGGWWLRAVAGEVES
uniref:MJ0042 family finger-like protein n=1 Tax=Geobacter sp. (strain M21) TaxID=443144 RepID=C6E008_GEOSM